MSAAEYSPDHQPCPVNVEVPTVTTKEIIVRHGREKTPAIQWYGDTETGLITDGQFLFPFMDPDFRKAVTTRPEWYKVVYLGQARNWPNPEVIPPQLTALTRGNDDMWITWIIDPEHIDPPNGHINSTQYLAQLIIPIGPGTGPITPREYKNADPLYEAKHGRVKGLIINSRDYDGY
jgi:hypothetical protein